jgi:threonine aldolase
MEPALRIPLFDTLILEVAYMSGAGKAIDLRSDTVTLPTAEMRRAMFEAELGDDVYGEDPTVKRLEALAADRMGKEAALFVVSGTMANLIGLLCHCGRGDEAIMGDRSHTFLFEAGSASAVGSIHPHILPNQPHGTLDLVAVEAAIRDPNNPHHPRTRLISLENSHNRCGGAVLTPAYMKQVRSLANHYGLAVHLDGARVFNAAVALGVDASDLAEDADTVAFCLSKGLAAPVGSVLCGSTQIIQQAHRYRKMLGGGMRQVGVLAAPGIVALETMVERLSEDHATAKQLAEGLAALPGIVLDPESVVTNLVIFDLAPGPPSAQEFAAGMAQRGVKIGAIGGQRIRAVTHYGTSPEDIDQALAAAQDFLTSD